MQKIYFKRMHLDSSTEILLKDIASIRTGVVSSRKRANIDSQSIYEYKLLNLHCIRSDGKLDISSTEAFYANEKLNEDFITKPNDILIRLSAPYSSAIIEQESKNLLVPSHFAIIRLTEPSINPYFVLWQLRQKSVMRQIYRNVSGTTQFGTINSGLFADLPIKCISEKQQNSFGKLFKLTEKEQELLTRLASEKAKLNRALMAHAFINLKKRIPA